MGDVNQLIFVRRLTEQMDGPFLEVGSKDYGSTQDLRALFAPRGEYIGVDMQDGRGVDVVMDLTEGFEQVDRALGRRRFGTIFCLSVLEHCREPFRMAENLMRLLKPGGSICISAPFSWKIHPYPNDYWRFTPEGIRELFPKLSFEPAQCLAATSNEGDFRLLDDEFGKIHFSFSKHHKSGYALRGVCAKTLKFASRLGALRWLTGYRYLHAPTNIMMVGTLNGAQGSLSSGNELVGSDK